MMSEEVPLALLKHLVLCLIETTHHIFDETRDTFNSGETCIIKQGVPLNLVKNWVFHSGFVK